MEKYTSQHTLTACIRRRSIPGMASNVPHVGSFCSKG
jgi:hypothetical protein